MAGSFNQIEKIGDYTVITASMNYASTTQLFAKEAWTYSEGWSDASSL